MKKFGYIAITGTCLVVGCGGIALPPPAIQSITETRGSIQIQYDPARIPNFEMREIARAECSKRGLVLTDVTVAPTADAGTAIANVFCG